MLKRSFSAEPGIPSRDARTLADLVLDFPDEKAGQTALTFLDRNGEELHSFSYAELRQSCVRIAKNLLRISSRPEPVLLATQSQADFVVGFFGCLLAGVIPAPMAPPGHKRHGPSVGRIIEILRQGHVRSLIVNHGDADWMRAALSDAGQPNVTLITIESLRDDDPPAVELPDIGPDQIAYLQFTSGSTSAPKGVVLKHRNVIAGLEMMYRVFRRDEVVRVASWLPLHHDMGLVGHLCTVLFECGFGVFMTPSTFLARPSLWLDVVHRYRANSSAAPNFALEHCVRNADPSPDWDLSCWKHVYVGSETVMLPALDTFAGTFGRCGFHRNSLRPAYGLAEASLLVAGGSLGLEELVPLVEKRPIGPAGHRHLMAYTLEEVCDVTIRDPDSTVPLADGVDGEIWIAGASVSSGYFPDPEGHDERRGIPTGDLGFVKDGCLYITGRKKEIVIVRGQNYSAEDLEFAAPAGIDRLGGNNRTACVSDVGDSGERVLVFQEIHRHTAPDKLRQAYLAIRGNLVEAFGIDPDEVVFLPTGMLPRTANNKIARQACRRQFLAGDLHVLAAFAKPVVARPQAGGPKGEADPVVIVGMACRFPGADDPQRYWENLCNGHDAITEVPTDRWNNELFYDESPALPGRLNTKWAGFLENISHFDAALFEISPHEAAEIDPQQRLLLETSWRLIENAGVKKESLAGSSTGVYVGISTNDYLYSKIKLTPGMSSFNAYSGLGNSNSIAANRLSYYYDLRGPSLAVDSACSSSLTAFHLGARAILNGECEQAIVGGVNAILSPGPTITLCQFGMMAPDGRCKTFDAGADGYVRAEGCGLVLLKRRSAALAHGDRILAVLDSTVIAQDGASPGITFPNGAAQDRLIDTALRQANLQGSEISYVEAHGTGTSAGDPVEMEQLKKHYGAPANEACFVGSVKANIGHLEAAAGIASVIKTVLMLQHAKIPPQIHVRTLNPRLRLENTRLAIPGKLRDWQTAQGRRRAAISSFGFGGSLAHVILAEPANDEAPTRAAKADFSGAYAHPFVVSAHTPEALKAQLAAMSDWLKTTPPTSFRNICYTLATARSDLRYRAAFLATSRKGIYDKIDARLHLDQEVLSAAGEEEICFLFTGQGEHYLHMGKEMYDRFPVFRAAFDRCAAAIDGPQHPFSLRDLAFSIEDTRLWTDQYMQPILFAVQYALAMLYRECGIRPNRVAGHSLGEYAAACLAGCLEPEAAMRILYRRGELIRSLPDKGFMAAIFAPADDIREVMDQAKVQVAAINGPRKTTISGEGYEVDRVMKLFADKGVETYFLKTDQAFHSHMLDPIAAEFRSELSRYSFLPPSTPWVSSVTGKIKTEAPDADYWTDHLRQPVLFGQATMHLGGTGPTHFIEIGPGATCLVSVRENLKPANSLFLRSLNVKKGERTESYFFLDAICQLYRRGRAIHWQPILTGESVSSLLPGLPFIQQRYWMKGISIDDFAVFATPASRPAISATDSQKDWHYQMEWVDAGAPSEPAAGKGTTRKFNWLIVGPSGPLLEALTVSIKSRREEVYCLDADSIGPASLFRRSAETSREARAEAWSKAIARIFNLKSRAGAVDWKILYVAGSGQATEWSAAALDEVQRREFGALIPMLQALRQQGLVHPVWVVTEDAQAVSPAAGAELNLGAAPVWGFCKTLYLEHPEWRGGMIDLSAADPARPKADNVVRKVVNPEFESCVALRGDRQHVQKIVRAPLSAGKVARFRDDGVYIITGGLGGLGLAFAQWAVARGARKLALLSRRTVPDQAAWSSIPENDPRYGLVRKLIALADAGAEVETISLDVRDDAALGALFDRLDEQKIPVRGIIHAAGVNWFGKVMMLEVDRFLDTLRTKITSSWELHRRSLDRDVDCFVLLSSVSALWGSVELSHYSAANQFMDMLSLHRGSAGLPASCIDWGPWADVGMSADQANQPVLEKLGFALMRPDEALAAMDGTLAAGRRLSLIADIDWNRFQVFIDFCLQPSMFANVTANFDKSGLLKPGKLDAILKSSPDEARAMIEKVVRMKLRAVTLIESSDTIDAEQRFNFMGMDSLMSLSFAAELESYFHAELPRTLIYNYPTIRAVSDFLFGLAYVPTSRAGSATAASPPPVDAGDITSGPAERGDWFKVLTPTSAGTTDKLFCFPYAGSGVSVFEPMALAIGAGIEVVGVQIPGREDHADVPACRRMDELIGSLVAVFAEPESDYFVFGHSLGAVVAYEFVLALQLAGKRPPRGLIVSGSNPPLARAETRLHELDRDEFVARIIETYPNAQARADRELALRRNEALLRADLELLETCQPSRRVVSAPLTVIRGRQDPLVDDRKVRQWVELSDSAFNLVLIDGDHELLAGQHRRVADIVRQAMRASQSSH
jgi:acyl transferase domain-containing protein/acyl-CoA synthetase (AMP-forming)/AMP-acid ligase II/surfactin synthase thioesterase subunit/acyl carrier protein